MRVIVLSTTVILMLISTPSISQNITYSEKNVRLETFFAAVTSQTGYVFFYNSNLLNNINKISLDLKSVSLQTALTEALKDQPLAFEIQGNTIFITHKDDSNVSGEDLLHPSKIEGRIRDTLGVPLGGVSVMLSGSKKGTISNNSGDFSLNAKPGDSILFSSIGYETKMLNGLKGFMSVIMQNDTRPLEQVIIGGNMATIKRKADVTSVTIVNAKTLDILPVNDISQIFRGLVPGTNSYSTGDITEESATLTIRGAGNEISISQIAVYVDGIEYAGGSGYLGTLNKENIDRIEVLRGPGSSTLYGTGSNGGIVQIFTKQGRPGQSSIQFTASAGFMKSKWVPSNPYQQFYSVESVSGLQNTALTLGGSFLSNGAYLPGGGGRSETFYAGYKWNITNKLTANFTGRYQNTRRHESRNPSYDTCIHPNQSALAYGIKPTDPTNKDIVVEGVIIGVNLSHQTTAHWINNLTAGFTENDNEELPETNDGDTIPLQRQYYSSTNKITTIRYSNILKFGNLNDAVFNMSIVSGAEYKKNDYNAVVISTQAVPFSNDPPNENYGFFIQANPSYKNIYLTAGLRYDRNVLFQNNGSLNPRIGATTNFTSGSLIMKPRISWGSGITPPSYTFRFGSQGIPAIVAPNPNIKPQTQQGFDYGLEFYDLKNRYRFEVIYYNNTLKNMFVEDYVTTPNDPYAFIWTNVASVANRGWEFSGDFNLISHFTLGATFSIMNSVVKDSTGNYLSIQLNGLAPGSRLTNLPRHTAGLFMNYNFNKLFGKKDHGALSFNITEVDGVYTLDLVRYVIDVAYGRTKAGVRDYNSGYWTSNGTIFRLGLNVDYYLIDRLRFFIQGYNIANNNKYEQRSGISTYGASWMFGIKYNVINGK